METQEDVSGKKPAEAGKPESKALQNMVVSLLDVEPGKSKLLETRLWDLIPKVARGISGAEKESVYFKSELPTEEDITRFIAGQPFSVPVKRVVVTDIEKKIHGEVKRAEVTTDRVAAQIVFHRLRRESGVGLFIVDAGTQTEEFTGNLRRMAENSNLSWKEESSHRFVLSKGSQQV